VVGLAGGFIGGLVLWFAGELLLRPGFGLSDSLVVGVGGGLAGGFAVGLEAPTTSAEGITAAESLVSDRRNALRKMLTFLLTVGVIGTIALGPAFGLAGGLATGLLVGLGTTAWGHWLILVRVWLPITDRLPWPVQAFVTDAYHRGVLRQAGAVYQFRHRRLQDRMHLPDPG